MKYHAAFSIRLDPPRIEKNVENFELFFRSVLTQTRETKPFTLQRNVDKLRGNPENKRNHSVPFRSVANFSDWKLALSVFNAQQTIFQFFLDFGYLIVNKTLSNFEYSLFKKFPIPLVYSAPESNCFYSSVLNCRGANKQGVDTPRIMQEIFY